MPIPAPVPRPCPVCGDPARTLIHDHRLAPIDGVSLHAGYQVVACAGCGMVYADGIPAQAAFDRYYQACSRYENGTRLGLATEVDQRRYRTIADELAGQLPDRAGSLAELGCATGGLLAELKRRGFQRLLGVDPSPLCGRTARKLHGVEVVAGTVFDPVPGGPHAVLVAVGVVEHLRDLDRAVANLAGSLVPGGLLFVDVPDLEGFTRTNEAPFQEFSTEHINFFTGASLDNLMGVHGLEPAFGGIVQRVHGGGSTMQSIARGYRKGAAAAPRFDPAGPRAAGRYRDLCAAQAGPETELAERLARAGEAIAVWGAGTVSCRLMAGAAWQRVPIAAFLDSNPHLQGHRLAGIPVEPPQWLRGFPGPVLIASKGYAGEILATLRGELGLANPVLQI